MSKNKTSFQQEDLKDLGFGSRVSQQTNTRLLNRDGSFNVQRRNASLLNSLDAYHALITMPWGKFFAFLVCGYVAINTVFACAYMLCGASALHGTTAQTLVQLFLDDFFFSVQTFATIGYGTMSPASFAANVLVSIEALLGLLAVAFGTGLLFSRFSRPTAHILYSNNAVVAPFRNGRALMFRIINKRSNQLINVEASVMFSRLEDIGGKRIRRYHSLALDRKSVNFFPLHWVIVHPIDEHSPMYNATAHSLQETEVEILIILSGLDETFSTTVHSRSSYRYEEIVFGAKFSDMFTNDTQGAATIDLDRIHMIEPAPLSE